MSTSTSLTLAQFSGITEAGIMASLPVFSKVERGQSVGRSLLIRPACMYLAKLKGREIES